MWIASTAMTPETAEAGTINGYVPGFDFEYQIVLFNLTPSL